MPVVVARTERRCTIKTQAWATLLMGTRANITQPKLAVTIILRGAR
jgi:hypothetical protein